MPRKKETITLSIPPGTKEKLEELAKRLEIFWGDKPSISGLISAIAQEKTKIGQLFTLEPATVKALHQGITLLIDEGYSEEARNLIDLLLNHGNLEKPYAQSLLHLLSRPSETYRHQVNEYIQKQQPFQVCYRNAQEQELTYIALYGEVSFYEKRYYLNIWCKETQDISHPDFPELIHNRCLRFDRLQGIQPVNLQWHHEGLDYVKVYLHFFRGMVKAYESKPEDLSNEVIGDVRQVVRKVSNPFWLIREVAHYWEDCVIVAPERLRAMFVGKLQRLSQEYQ